MDVDKVAFTGSTEVAKLFLRYSGESNLKGVQAECGGKSPNIILADVSDIARAAAESAEAIFANAGQSCNAGSRLLLHESVVDEFLERLRTECQRWQAGDPLDPATKMGAIVSEEQLERVLRYIKTGINEGATLAVGGSRVRVDTGGYYVEPTIFTDANNGMQIARDEIFGPVLTTLIFESEDDALRIANDTRYGLSAAVWTRDISKAHRFAKAMRGGTVYVNCYDRGDISLAFGGFKESGFGRDKSLHAIENYSEIKTTYINLV